MSSHGRILLIDDDPFAVHVLEAQLNAATESTVTITTVASAMRAMTQLRKHQFDVIVTDQHLHSDTGIALIHDIRKSYPRTSCFLISGEPDLTELTNEALKAGAINVFRKPVEPEAICQILDHVSPTA